MATKTKSNQGIDMLVSFDTTGSMSQVINSVRREVQNFVKEMHAIDPDIRIGIIAHGDYCDKDNPYTIRVMDFTSNVEDISEFVRGTQSTYGGDADECYELVLQTARTAVNWKAGRRKVMVLIGDANPHPVGYTYGKHRNEIDWKNELKLLAEMGVQIFPIHAMAYYRSGSTPFYKALAKETDGVYLNLDQFHEVTDLLLATSVSHYTEEQINQFVTVVKERGRMTRSMASNIKRLTGKEIEVQGLKAVQAAGMLPVPPGRFQVIEVDTDTSIKEFILANELPFKKGRGFYELTKAETVQQYKEIILEDKATGELYTGAEVREYLKLSPQVAKGGTNEKVYSSKTREYIVYVQSTSTNRRLIGGTRLLYEVDDIL